MSTPLQPRQWAADGGGGNYNVTSGGMVKSVDLNEVHYSQHDIDEAKVNKLMHAMKRGAMLPPAVASQAGGRVKIQDGHHRVEAARRMGKKRITVKVF